MIKPTGSRVLIKITDEDISRGGIIIPKAAIMRSINASIGVIEAVGPGYLEDIVTNKWTPCTRKVGEKVLVNKDAGLKIPKEILIYILGEKDATDYILIGEQQIMAVIEDEVSKEK